MTNRFQMSIRGITNQNEFYSDHYLDEILAGDLKDLVTDEIVPGADKAGKETLEQGERSLIYAALSRARKSVAVNRHGERSGLVPN